jgi:5-methylcytosine-specific restriction endonuclease McrA
MIKVDLPNESLTARGARQRLNRKLRCVAYKGGKCSKCGYAKSLRGLHFHHRDREDKLFSIAQASCSWEVTKQELDKCDLLCANCHGEEEERLDEGGLNYISDKVQQSDSEKEAISQMVDEADRLFNEICPPGPYS